MAGPDRKMLGEMLVEDGLITKEQLNEALETQKKSPHPQPVGELLVTLGHLSEEGLALTLSKKLRAKYLSLSDRSLEISYDQNLDRLIDEKFARTNLVLPLSKNPRQLVITMWDPLNFVVIDNIRRLTNLEPVVNCSPKKDIVEGIERLYVRRVAPSSGTGSQLLSVDIPFVKRDEVDKLKSEAAEPPVVKIVNQILQKAAREKASDVHIEPRENGAVIRYRVDGTLYEAETPPIELLLPVISRIKILSRLDIAEKRLPQDGGFMVKVDNRAIDLRVSSIPTIYGEKLAIRILDKEAMDFKLSSVGLGKKDHQKVSENIRKPYGLILVTGPTGSGKTTTLYCILNEIKSSQKNILTIEDPVEYRINGISQVQAMPNIGLDFAQGLRAFLRQDPDIIMVGEVRDIETADICVRAALVGRLVLSTLHTNNSIGAISRLLDLGIEPFLVGTTVVMVIAQRLVRRLCPDCKEIVKLDSATAAKFKLDGCKVYGPKGCPKCHNRGYAGRLAIFEIMNVDQEISAMIEKRQDITVIENSLIKKGMTTLRDDGLAKVREGLTSLNEVVAITAEIA